MRILLLTIGPVVIVGLNYWLTMPFGQEGLAAVFNRQSSSAEEAGSSIRPADLQTACEATAHDLRPLLSANCRTIVRSPFVIGGDLSEKELDRYYRQLILPITGALANSYFDRPPDAPITILMFSSDRSYRDHAMRIDGSRRSHYYGFYQRTDRRLILNISTGDGTLAHELTHALAHFDFPDMPEWFDEGLASLHEQSEFSDDETRLVGLNNWRLNYLLHAINRGRLRTIESLMSSRGVRVEQQATDRAHRIGQVRRVQVHKFVCIGTLEERIDALLEKKKNLADRIVGTGEKWLTELSTDKLREVLELSREAVAEP